MESYIAHHKEEDAIYPLTLTEIADAQRKDQELKVYHKKKAKMPQKDVCFHLIEDTKVLFKNGNTIIPTSLRRCRKPPRYVLYKATYVPYNGTYGASDQGQMLEV